MPRIRLSDMSKHFGKILAVDDVHLQINNGEYFSILGPTGSGKTTLLRLIAGLIHPDKGEILFDETRVNALLPEERDAAYLPQQYALFPHLSVLSNVTFGPLTRGHSKEEAVDRARKALETVQLSHRADALPAELSGGMQQRVALARAFASGAKLLLLDEPLGALDARLRTELRYRLKNLVKSAGLTAIHVTHDQREAMIVADRIAILRSGRIEQVGTPYHVYRRPANIFVANFLGETNFIEGTIREVDSEGSSVELLDDLSVRVRDTSFLPDEHVVLALRQEVLSIVGTNRAVVNAISGIVKAVRFLGDSVRAEIRIAERALLMARIPLGRSVVVPKPGERFTFTFRPEDVAVFSVPARGLSKELEAS